MEEKPAEIEMEIETAPLAPVNASPVDSVQQSPEFISMLTRAVPVYTIETARIVREIKAARKAKNGDTSPLFNACDFRDQKIKPIQAEIDETQKAMISTPKAYIAAVNGAFRALKDEMLKARRLIEEEIKATWKQLKPEDGTKTIRTGNSSTTIKEMRRPKIVDKEKFVKAIISKAKNRGHITLDMIEPNIPAIRAVMLKNKAKIPGVEWEEYDSVV
jgi:hypothetical protein